MRSDLVLVVEDEPGISSVVEMYLTAEGFRVETATGGERALELAERLSPSLIILDVMLPDIDGFEVCRRLRAAADRVPIIMLTARDDEVDRVVGLEIGADDYVTKPFSARELVARVKAVLRRTSAPAPKPQPLSLGDVSVDEQRREVRVGSSSVTLTAKEFDLLAFLIANKGIVFSRDHLLESVWGYERAVDSRTVDSHVRSIRSKLGESQVIRTVRGVGYKADL